VGIREALDADAAAINAIYNATVSTTTVAWRMPSAHDFPLCIGVYGAVDDGRSSRCLQ